MPVLSLPILALAVASFGIGTTEFVIMGLLPELATDLHVGIPSAGLLVSGYALSVAVGAPLLAVATGRLPRKAALLLLIGIFIVGNLFCALAPGYWTLMAARVVTAFCHGAFFGTGAVVASALVAPNRRAQAVSLMFSGLTLANVLGVPLGTALGNALGWRATFWAVVAIGLLAAAALALWLPAGLKAEPVALRRELRALAGRQVLLAMLVSALASASLFSVFTYIAPLLQHVTGLSQDWTTAALLLFGVGLTVGNLIGGRMADWRLMPSVIGLFVALAAVLAGFSVTAARATPALLTLFAWGALAFALVSPLQIRVVNEARDAPNLASTVNQGVFNIGNAAGAWIGGVAIGAGVGYAEIPLIGAAVALVALGFALWSYRLDRQAARREAMLGQAALGQAAD
ncbi:MFS transporter [Roseomonas sp. NAR14]|uniref:MFS transporter n=1 Tax=Roseomonas acroporae TaxID=2937791 RepID=A0A9X1Y9Q9_9PROT|nr:MFS transporter [Roseomonas acroporae]MCK8785722.1 MFS transporter [Roseomonas acroporae]